MVSFDVNLKRCLPEQFYLFCYECYEWLLPFCKIQLLLKQFLCTVVYGKYARVAGSNTCWSCTSQGFYRDLPCGASGFSCDGSLLAVAFQTTLTLWDPDTVSLRHTQTLPDDIR